jgi:hypothetical protein
LPQIEGQRPWTDQDFYNDPSNFQFVIVSDRTGGHRDGVFKQAIEKINLLRPEFVISVGDLIEGYTDDLEQVEREWTEFNSFLEPLLMKFFYVPGNHDIWNAEARAEWERRFGPSYYHFVYGNVLFLCLNSEDGAATQLGEEQLGFVKKTLGDHSNVKWTLVFLHKPLWYYQEAGRETGWDFVQKLLQDRPHTVFAGHRHQYVSYERDTHKYYELATTGGSSRLTGPVHGRFDHIIWVTMTDEGPALANLLLDGVLDREVRTEQGTLLINELSQSYDVRVDPVHIARGEPFSGSRTHVRLTNRADIPMEVQVQFAPHAFLRPYPYAFTRTVDPHSVDILEVALETATEIDFPSTAVLPVDVGITFRPDILRKPLVWERTFYSVVERPVVIPQAKPGVLVDGSLEDWARLPFVVDRPAQITGAVPTWSGPQDLSFSFGVQQDEQFIYLAIRTRDDHRTSRSRVDSSYQDHLGIMIDPRPEVERNQAVDNWNTLLEQLIYFRAVPPAQPGPAYLGDDRRNAEEVMVVGAAEAGGGFVLECAIPHAKLDAFYGGSWQSLRLNLFVRDVDSLTGSVVQLWWRPLWNAMESYPSSGTFYRK